jgi:exodeoxyribonuclease V gamma subunit
MRSIPFEVVCLMGMNDGEFPRRDIPMGFDLIAQRPQLGDRSPKNEDRYLFIEALLAARSHLLVTYTGRSMRDERVLPPSAVVEDLIDCICSGSYLASEQATQPPQQENRETRQQAVKDWLIVHHPMQPFHVDYFSPATFRLFSFSELNEECARLRQIEKTARRPFIDFSLPEQTDQTSMISLEDLIRFFKSPTAFFLQSRLGLFLSEPTDLLQDREPFEIDSLEKYKAASQFLGHAMAARDLREFKPMMQAKGILPLGNLGESRYASFIQDIQPILDEWGRYAGGTPLEPLYVDLNLGPYRITGEIRHLWHPHRLVATTARIHAHHKLACWIHHLILNALNDPSCPRSSILIGSKPNGAEIFSLDALAQGPAYAQTILRQLIEVYILGLCEPISFFPKTSYAYAKSMHQRSGKNAEYAALEAAQKKWYTQFKGPPGDQDNPYVQCVYKDALPFNPDADRNAVNFQSVSCLVFEPLLQSAGSGGSRY